MLGLEEVVSSLRRKKVPFAGSVIDVEVLGFGVQVVSHVHFSTTKARNRGP